MTIPEPPRRPASAADASATETSVADASVTEATDAAAVADAPNRDGWWRRNRLALLAVAVLVPVIGLGIPRFEWQIGYSMAPAQTPVEVADEGTLDLRDATWGPIRSDEIDDLTGLDMPPDTKLIAAVIPVDPDAGSKVACNPPRLVQQSTGREWKPVRSEIGIPYAAEERDTCDSTTTEPYQLVVGFVLPEDVSGPFWLEVTSLTDPTFVRFSIDP